MVFYLANPSRGLVNDAMTRGVIGCITSPRQGNLIPPGALFGADNGCGPSADSDGQMRTGKGWPGDREFIGFLDALAPLRDRCLFATAPDVVGDAAATLARSAPFLPVIRELGYPPAFVAQNGIEHTAVQWDKFDVLFIGGDDDFKLGPVAREHALMARRQGKRVHMGRVNSLRRLRYADHIGCHTADGTFLKFGPHKNLARIQRYLSTVNDQGKLWEAVS